MCFCLKCLNLHIHLTKMEDIPCSVELTILMGKKRKTPTTKTKAEVSLHIILSPIVVLFKVSPGLQ